MLHALDTKVSNLNGVDDIELTQVKLYEASALITQAFQTKADISNGEMLMPTLSFLQYSINEANPEDAFYRPTSVFYSAGIILKGQKEILDLVFSKGENTHNAFARIETYPSAPESVVLNNPRLSLILQNNEDPKEYRGIRIESPLFPARPLSYRYLTRRIRSSDTGDFSDESFRNLIISRFSFIDRNDSSGTKSTEEMLSRFISSYFIPRNN